MKMFLVSGVPQSVRMDGWWMNEPPKPRSPCARNEKAPAFPRIITLLALIAAGDALLWQAEPGLSLALFGFAILLAVWLLTGRRGTGGLFAAALLFLPLIEHAQALSLGFFFAGLILGTVWIALGGWDGHKRLYSGAFRFLQSAPSETIRELEQLARHANRRVAARPHFTAQAWGLPLGLGLIFAALLLSANPMIGDILDSFMPQSMFDVSLVERLLFWAGLALICLPFLRVSYMRERLKLPLNKGKTRAIPVLFNLGSISRSLVLFNAMFAAQTLLDLIYLWGGAGLPDGMSYAAYAHRGAYPLLATALLAGVFAMLARPFTDKSRLLRAALLGWVAQNVFLVLSSLYRLEAYVSAYGLTHLRIAAAIWMILVALGLMLIIAQTLGRKPAAWLFERASLLGILALYAASFLSFSATIARYNLSHDVPLDRSYICNLGPHALPAIYEYETRAGRALCTGPKIQAFEFEDWREWGFRDWRLQRSLAALTQKDAH